MTLRRAAAAAFPGSRVVWLTAAVVVIALAAIFGRELLSRPTPLSGTNSVDVGTITASPKHGETTCIRDLVIPRGTKALQLFAGPLHLARPTRLTGTITAGNERYRATTLLTAPDTGSYKALVLDHSPAHDTTVATFCFRAPTELALGGAFVQRLPDAPVTTVAGQPLQGSDISVRYLSTTGRPSMLVTRWPDAFTRAGLFKGLPGGVMWVVLFALLAGAYVGVRTTATLTGRSERSLARRAYGLALVSAAAWALMMPIFFGPDETEHFAYVQHLASTGHRADAEHTARGAYSTDELVLMDALHHNSTIIGTDGRPRWSRHFVDSYQRWEKADPKQSDGGGYTEAASGHSPVYYAILAVPYKALDRLLGLPKLVLALRLFNALFAALVAALALLTAARLFPKQREAWWVAGCLVAFQPGFASVSGTVNNDTGVNVCAAAALFLVVDAWAHGPRRWRMLALGLIAAALPLMKITGFAMWPVIALGLLLIAWRHRRARWRVPTAVLWPVGVVVVLLSVWLAAGGSLRNQHPVASAVGPAGASSAAVGPTFFDKLNYTWQTIVPVVHFGQDMFLHTWPLADLYVRNGYGRYGWQNAAMQPRLLTLLIVVLGIGWAIALAAAWRARATWRRWGPPVGLLLLAILGVITLVAFAYVTLAPRATFGEQGRYIYPAMLPLAVLMSAGVTALRGRARMIYMSFATAGAAMIGVIGWASALNDWFV